MKASFLRVLPACVALSWAAAGARGQADRPAPTISPDVPKDVEIPSGFGGNPIAFFDDLSWRTFVALNWPALEGRRGEPDRAKPFGAPAANVVWGTWKADHEVFQPGGKPPAPWDDFSAVSPDKQTPFDAGGKVKVLGGFGRLASDLQIEHFNQAAVGTEVGSLVARNRHYVRYEVRINKAEFEFIQNGQFYLFERLPKAGEPTLAFPTGAIEVKAAWRRFSPGEAGQPGLVSRYLTSKAILIDPDGTRTEASVGLIGLHIVHRTPSRREWVWSTFEHVDTLDGAEPALQAAPAEGPANQLRPVVNVANPPLANPDPVPVRRVKALHESTVQTNRAYRDRLKGTVWENYQLVMTQWPVLPAANEEQFKANFAKDYPAGAGAPFPQDAGATSIANVTMETTQVFQASFSCMKCHFQAGKRFRTEFVWTVPLRAFRPTGGPEELAALKQWGAKVLSEGGRQ